MRLRIGCMLALFAVFGGLSFGADISVPTYDLITRGYMDSGTFKLATYGDIDLNIGGGYKFGGNLVLNFTDDDIGDLSSLAATHLTFKEADLTMKDLFGAPIDLTYFTGYDDTFGNGDVFPDAFGTQPIASRLRGYLYFPTGTLYDGIYTVAGTGLKLSMAPSTNHVLLSTYLYQDAELGAGHYASDLRAVFNYDHFKAEAFAGASYPESTAGVYRAGALFFFDTGTGGQFLTEIGVPRWDPVKDTFAIGLFYFLFEPRIDFGSFAIIPTLFWHPEYYNEQPTDEVPTANINVDFRFGNPYTNAATGGFETEVDYSQASSNQFTALVSPYLNLVASGVLWQLKVNVKLYPFSLSDIAEGFVGVQAQF